MAFSLGQFARARRQMRRVAPILKVLVRHGFGHLVQRINQRQFLGFRIGRGGGGREYAGEFETISTPKRLVMALQELGPTFVKLGQMLSTRADLLPEAYLTELRALTDRVKPFDASLARRIVEEYLGCPISEVFSEFGTEPVASGSIGQVHHAILRTGEPVVVKVKRPDIEGTILADLDLLELIAHQLDRLEELKPFRPVMVVDEFRRTLRREVDFLAEAALTAKVGEGLAKNPRVRVPKVHWECTSANVLTLERVSGISLNRREEIAAADVDTKQLARDLAEVFLQQFFRTGLFHADPHPGNILITPDGKIGLVDFGMTGRLDNDLRRCLATSFIALAARDMDIITEIYMEIGALPEDTDVNRLKADLHEVLDKYYGIPAGSIDMRTCFGDVMRVARTHRVQLPRDFVLLGKSFVTMVMMAKELDPSFDLAAVAKPYALSLAADKISPKRLGHDLLSQAWSLAQAVRRLPRDVRSISRRLLSGTLQMTVNVRQFEGLVQELDKATNRLAFSVIVSGVVIGSSMLLHARVPPYVERIAPGWLGRFFESYMPQTSALGLAGFLFAGILGMLLAVAIWRSGRL